MVLLESILLDEHAWALAEKIRQALSRPFELLGLSQAILPSIGVALYPEHGDEEQKLLEHGDEAMYVAKKSGATEHNPSTGLPARIRIEASKGDLYRSQQNDKSPVVVKTKAKKDPGVSRVKTVLSLMRR